MCSDGECGHGRESEASVHDPEAAREGEEYAERDSGNAAQLRRRLMQSRSVSDGNQSDEQSGAQPVGEAVRVLTINSLSELEESVGSGVPTDHLRY